MSDRTRYLDLLVLVSLAVPAQAVRLAMSGRRRPDVLFAGAMAVIAALAYFLVPIAIALPAEPAWSFLPEGPGWNAMPDGTAWYLIAVGAGLIAPLTEYLTGAVAQRRFSRMALHDRSGTGLLATAAALVAAAAEEVIFRGVALSLLDGLAGVWVAVAVTSVCYGLNHLYFGKITVWQKTLTGVGFGVLFVLSGSLLVPLIAHAVQNLVVLLVLPRLTRDRKTPAPPDRDGGNATQPANAHHSGHTGDRAGRA
jgi:membrane protease YdiL (CAAX protease family)